MNRSICSKHSRPLHWTPSCLIRLLHSFYGYTLSMVLLFLWLHSFYGSIPSIFSGSLVSSPSSLAVPLLEMQQHLHLLLDVTCLLFSEKSLCRLEHFLSVISTLTGCEWSVRLKGTSLKEPLLCLVGPSLTHTHGLFLR